MSSPTTVNVVKRDGTIAPYDGYEVARSIEAAAHGLTDSVARATQIQSELEITLFDGITTEELDEAVIGVALQNVKDDPDFDVVAVRLLLKTQYKRVLGIDRIDGADALRALGEDLGDFERMSPAERHALTFLMSYFNPNELLVNKALAFGVYPYVNAAEAHLYLAKQMWEEANHCMAFEYVLETFPIDRADAYASHVDVPSMAAKEEFEIRYIKRMTEQGLDIEAVQGKRDFVRNPVAFNVVLEGVWFYSGFMVALSFRQRNLLRNFGSLIDWVVRDESLHLKFGINLILTVLEENPDIASDDFAAEIRGMILHAVELEEQYNRDLLPRGLPGLSAGYLNTYVRYLADRRLEELPLKPAYHVANPAKWMATANDTLQLVNFFESINTSYEVDARA